jgi:hypothetical protein
MVLQKQLIQIPFNGVQTKIDPKVAPLGTYETIDNFVMNRYPELVKRNGLGIIGESTTPENIVAGYNYLNEVGVITDNSLYSYSESLDQFQLKGLTASPVINSSAVIANTYTQTVCDSAITTNSLIGAIWEDSRGGVRCSIKDTDTGTFLVADYSLSTTGIKPKVVAVGISLVFTWVENSTTELKIQKYRTNTNTFGTLDSVTTDLASSYTYDIIKSLSNVFIVAATTNAAPDVFYGYYWNVSTESVSNGGDGLYVPTSLDITNSGATPPTVSVATDTSNTYLVITWQNNSKEVYTKTFGTVLLAITSELQVASATTDAGYAMGTCVDSSNNTYIYYSTYNTIHTSYRALVTTNITVPAVSYNSLFYYYLGVASKAFFYSNNAYVVLAYTSSLQASYFGVRNDGACFGRLFSSLGGGNIAKANCVSSFYAVPDEDNTFSVALLKTTKVISSANSFYSTTSVFTEKIFFTPNNIDNKMLGRLLNIAGGYLKQYDGSPTVFEQGFHLYPEAPTLAESNGSGSIANGTYSYVCVWEWVDNQGQVHRSNTSVPTIITTTGANDTVTVTVKTLPITNKETRFSDVRTPIVLAVYRTQTLGTTYYRVNQLTSEYVYNDPTAATIDFVDTKTDAQIASNSLLYTTGGVFANITLPSSNLMAVGKNRVFIAGTDTEPNRIYYSKEKEEGLAVEFSNELSVIVDSLGGNISALAAMDDKLLIFKKSVIYFIAGQGQDKVGNGSFTIPQLVSADCGCNTPQSIVLTGKGIMFQSQKGIYLVDRQLNVSYIGQSLDAITTNRPTFFISSATNLPDQNLVYFTTNEGQTIVFDTYFEQWYTHTLPFTPVGSTVLNNTWFVCSNTNMYQSDPDLVTDAGENITSLLRTNWISIGELEGFARIYNILILGDNASLDHQLVVNLYYDFEQYPRQTVSIIPNSLSGATYGTDTPYGSGTPYGGAFDGTYQFMIRPQTQKCTSIKIEIFDQFPNGEKTKSFKFSGIALSVGVKGPWNKGLGANRRLT